MRAVARYNDPVTFFQIRNLLCQRRKGKRVRTQIGLAIAIADNQRAAEPCADKKIRKLPERNRKRKRAAQTRQHSLHRVRGRMAGLHLFGHQMRDNLSIGFAFKCPAAGDEFIAQLLEILDNTIVHQCHFACGMGVRVARRRCAMRGPAGVRNADISSGIVGLKHVDKVRKLALCTATNELAIMHGANTGGVITPILHPL